MKPEKEVREEGGRRGSEGRWKNVGGEVREGGKREERESGNKEGRRGGERGWNEGREGRERQGK
jgi:hypothetical protein